MKQIGEFANENQVTIKALHHYEKLGLIRPAKVDESTGYRYYDDRQAETLFMISYFKSLGFSLSEIKSVLDSKMDIKSLKKALYAKKKQSEMDVDSSKTRYERIVALLELLAGKEVGQSTDIVKILNMIENTKIINLSGHEKFVHLSIHMYEKAQEENSNICALSIDIDNFKSINDNFGYDIGDIVIERIMNVLISELLAIAPEDDKQYSILERDGGDEFRIMVSDNIEVCKKLARNIINSVKSIAFDDIIDGLNVSVTIGIAQLSSDTVSASHLFHFSETALYEAKSKKRGTYMVYAK